MHYSHHTRKNNLEDLVRVWNQWDSDTRGIFTERYGDIANLIAVNVDERLIQAMVRFWDLAYACFTFNQEDMTPTIEEYIALLRVENAQFHKVYVKEPKPMTFKKKLIKKKNETICIPWFSIRDLVLNHPDTLKRVNLFALAIYGLIIFPKVLGHIEVAVVDFFERLKQRINPVPTILAETFRSLNSCRKTGKGRFIGCAQLLNVWILSHFWKVERTPYHMFSKTFAPLEAYIEREWPKDVTEEHWVSVFQNLRAEDIIWRAPWIRPSVLLYKVMTSRSKRQELKKRIQELEDMLEDHQQQLDTLLKALEEKDSQYDRDVRAYEEGLQEKEIQLSYLINEVRGVAMHVVQLSEEAEILICQFPPSRRSNISEFLARVKKYGDIARKFV
ncbi:hypothetical protein PVK06_011702 [Gossypium arboreum]|uniref:DUF7745 domain-containing protein n=1 Tax=Gossypium arboreum TaxID=29729 RepID=A0ABR0QAC4_GOSAR|nr:hypothetical protein PVK06_011702 [Gossypium arboreum]